MKNKLMKIMSVVLTLAVLSGLLIVAVPVSAATQSWSTIKGPPVIVGTSANVFTIADDGKTVYMYANVGATTKLAVAITEGEGPDTIGVDSTVGFPSAGSLKIGTETVAYTAIVVDTEADPVTYTFTGVSGWPSHMDDSDPPEKVYDNAAHEVGDVVNLVTADAGMLYKSTDAGITWSSANLDTTTPKVITGKVITAIRVSKASSADVVATDGVSFFRSTNSGRTWATFSLPDPFADGDSIYGVDIASGENGIAYLAATSKGVFLYDADLLIWVHLGGEEFDARAANFSPNYENVPMIVAVVNDAGGIIVKTIRIGVATTSAWGNAIADCTLKDSAGSASMIASIAFPSNYSSTSSTSRVYVGIGETNAAADPPATTGVFRVNGGTTASTPYDLGANFNVSSLAYSGTISTGVLAAGGYNDFIVKTTTNVGANSPTWTDSTNPPYGSGNAQIFLAFVPHTTTLYAGAAGLGSGLAMSTNYLSFSQISMISVSAYANVNMGMAGGHTSHDGVVQFQLLFDSGVGASMIFKSTDSGATWKEIYNNKAYNNGTIQVFSTTPGDKDYQTLWIQQAAPDADKYIKSTDGGANWDSYNFPSIMGQINSLSIVDANTFIMGSSAGIRKSTSTAIAYIDGKTPLVMINIPGFFLTWSTTGEVYVSKDDGVTFERLGSLGQFAANPAFSPAKLSFVMGPNPTIYCVEVNSGNIVKWTYGVDSSWSIALNASQMPDNLNTYDKISSFSAGAVWYVQSPATNPQGQLWRAVDPLNPNPDEDYGFEPITGTTFNGGTVSAIPFLSSIADANGVPTYYTCIKGLTATNKYPANWVKYTDVLLAAPKVTAPADGSVVGSTVTITQGQAGNYAAVDFAWSPVAYTSPKYVAQISYDSTFTNVLAQDESGRNLSAQTTGTTLTAIYLLAGKSFYFRVKVASPMMSKWSTPVHFNTMIPSDVNQGLNAEGRISPINGASGVPLTPAITWGAVNSATSYDFKIATDAAFSNVVESKDGLTTTVFSPSKPLSANTVYFWEVRANSGTNIGNWVISSFTTAAPISSGGTGGTVTQPAPTVIVNVPTAAPAPAPVFTVPPAQVTVAPANITVNPTAPETPAYIWIIIAIGAVLVIAVIVLIARTRRV